MKAFITSLQQQKHNHRTSLLQCNTFKLSTCLPVWASLVFGSLHTIATFTKGKSVTKEHDKACKQDIN